MAFSTSAALACGWEIRLGACLFTEAELAAADLLVQLSGGGRGDEASSSSLSSPRSVNTCAGAAAWEAGEEDEMAIAAGLGAVEELDKRARKRFRLLADLYVATRPVTGAGAKKRKRDHETEAEVLRPRW